VTYTEQAASAIAGPNAKAVGGPPWDALLEMLRDLARQLLDCAPTPAEGHEYLTREFAWWETLLGFGRRRERAVRRAVRLAGGDERDADKILAAIEAGKLDAALMRGLYDEARR
jgi:hypothetical protein